MRSVAVDHLIGSWTKQQQAITLVLRDMILDASPAIVESVKFNVPFYVMNGFLFYISPQKKGGVQLAFCLGRHMADDAGIFTGHNLKEVRHVMMTVLDEKLLEIVMAYIFEAVALNRTKRSFVTQK